MNDNHIDLWAEETYHINLNIKTKRPLHSPTVIRNPRPRWQDNPECVVRHTLTELKLGEVTRIYDVLVTCRNRVTAKQYIVEDKLLTYEQAVSKVVELAGKAGGQK